MIFYVGAISELYIHCCIITHIELYYIKQTLSFFTLLLPQDLSDYTTTKDTITFTSGQSVGYAVNVSIPITSDTMAESIESFFTSITLLPTNLNVLVQPSSAEVFIQDDDSKD